MKNKGEMKEIESNSIELIELNYYLSLLSKDCGYMIYANYHNVHFSWVVVMFIFYVFFLQEL